MPKFMVELWLDGYDSEAEMDAACETFIHEQLNFTASEVKIRKITPEAESLFKELESAVEREKYAKERIAELEINEIDRLRIKHYDGLIIAHETIHQKLKEARERIAELEREIEKLKSEMTLAVQTDDGFVMGKVKITEGTAGSRTDGEK